MLQLTNCAVLRLRGMVACHGISGVQLRVFVKGGGCKGMRHKFCLAPCRTVGDAGMTRLGVRLVADPLSLMYLRGSVVDCGTGVGDARLVVYHPSAGMVCSCGASFAPA
ncbi:putative protein HesB [Candidatus Tremblaya princeps PCVAL]|nr:putative protein HesB [Candidatus Tremblaya princeps PCVAL]